MDLLTKKLKAMNKPKIKFHKTAYIQCDRITLDELISYSQMSGYEQVFITGCELAESDYKTIEDPEIVIFIDKVLEYASDCDIIFHL